jgi:hypothetical protein
MTPHGEEACPWCGDPLLPGQVLYDFASGRNADIECAVRIIFGSLGEMERRYAYRRGPGQDPPGLSRREAACAAYRFLKVTCSARLRN